MSVTVDGVSTTLESVSVLTGKAADYAHVGTDSKLSHVVRGIHPTLNFFKANEFMAK